jgi:hypothetical protein
MSDHPLLPKNFVQTKQYEAHESLSILHRVVNQWWGYVQSKAPHDPRVVVRCLRATAKTLSALADQVEVEIRKADASVSTEDRAA